MSITSSVGIFSGIDTANLIDQLLQIEARPRFQFQARIQSLQVQQSAYLDINSRLRSLQDAAAAFRNNSIFDQKITSVSDEDSIGATATGATPRGSYLFQVDRLVTTQNMLSRGFSDRDQSAFGASSFTFESDAARLEQDVELSSLNGGDGIRRGSILLTVDGDTRTIDLSRAASVNDVLDAINESGLNVTATADDGSFVLTADSGTVTVAEVGSGTTAETLGLLNGTNGTGTLTGDDIYSLDADFSLAALNDNNGVFINSDAGTAAFDFKVIINGDEVSINLGDIYEEVPVDPDPDDPDAEPETTLELTEARVGTLGAAVDRINQQLADGGYGEISVLISDDGLVIGDALGGRVIEVEDNTSTSGSTAADLGIAGTFSDVMTGDRLLAGLDTKLAANLNGGAGLSGTLDITARNGNVFSIDLTSAETIEEVMDAVDAATGGQIVLGVNDAGTGFTLNDTGGGTGNLIVSGDTADQLRLATDPAGIAEASVRGNAAQFAYITAATSVDNLNNGRGIGLGTFRISDGSGLSAEINIGSDTETVGQLLDEINGQLAALEGPQTVFARVNDNGDGILIEEQVAPGEEGAQRISVEDLNGVVARNLRIAGTAEDSATSNSIDGSYEITVEFESDDTLDDVVEKLNDADAGLSVSVLNDGSIASPFRLSFTSDRSGSDGRFTFDTGGFDLGLDTISVGENARVFYGSRDPASAVLLSSSTNTLDGVVPGLSLDLKQTTDDAVTVGVSEDNDAAVEAAQEFIDAFNDVISRIDSQTRFDEETETRGPLLGDSTMITLRNQLFGTVTGTGDNIDGQYQRLLSVGVEIGDGGVLTLNEDRFREALTNDREAIAELFTRRDLVEQSTTEVLSEGVTVNRVIEGDEFSALGVLGKIEQLTNGYINSVDGVLTRRNQTIDNQIQSQQDRIDTLDARLEDRRLILERQFLAMEQSIASLQSQQASLGQISGIG
ncbi:MAG: flagellar filament capping protein FliD [Planctomycetota bacterium]